MPPAWTNYDTCTESQGQALALQSKEELDFVVGALASPQEEMFVTYSRDVSNWEKWMWKTGSEKVHFNSTLYLG